MSYRKQLIRKYGSCFICMQRGHKATIALLSILAQYVRGNTTSPYARALRKGSKLPLVNKLTLLNPVRVQVFM